MNRRVLLVEPDAAVQRMTALALSAAGLRRPAWPRWRLRAPSSIRCPSKSRSSSFALRATHADGTRGVRALRADYPELPIIVTGSRITLQTMHESMRARVDDVVTEPFTPRGLILAVEQVLRNARTRGAGGMEYSAAMVVARRAIVVGRLADADAPLARARAMAPLDGEAMALLGLVRELDGLDDDADRAYRAALALKGERISDDALPREGLARLFAYDGARVAPSIGHSSRATLWFVGDALSELPQGSPCGAAVNVIVLTLGLVPSEGGATHARLHDDGRAFIVATTLQWHFPR
jgi:CheY-like chemotaxis protein